MKLTQYLWLRQLFDADSGTYTYLLYETKTHEALLIDTVKERFLRDARLIHELGLNLRFTLDTHVHADHITAAGIFRRNFGIQTIVGDPFHVPCADLHLKDGEEIQLGQFKVKVIATPGHSGGCVSYFVEGAVFTGDCLLIRRCGRTDFQQGDPTRLYHSIMNQLYSLPDDTLVFPGHDYEGRSCSTIGEEKSHNIRIRHDTPLSDFVGTMGALNLPRPKLMDIAVPANLGCGLEDTSSEPSAFFTMRELGEIYEILPSNTLLLDCRTHDEFTGGHVPGAVNIPMGEEEDQLERLLSHSRIIVYCRSGRRAQTVTANLEGHGCENVVCVGSSGIVDWDAMGLPSASGK